MGGRPPLSRRHRPTGAAGTRRWCAALECAAWQAAEPRICPQEGAGQGSAGFASRAPFAEKAHRPARPPSSLHPRSAPGDHPKALTSQTRPVTRPPSPQSSSAPADHLDVKDPARDKWLAEHASQVVAAAEELGAAPAPQNAPERAGLVSRATLPDGSHAGARVRRAGPRVAG